MFYSVLNVFRPWSSYFLSVIHFERFVWFYTKSYYQDLPFQNHLYGDYMEKKCFSFAIFISKTLKCQLFSNLIFLVNNIVYYFFGIFLFFKLLIINIVLLDKDELNLLNTGLSFVTPDSQKVQEYIMGHSKVQKHQIHGKGN